jgi:hypothetical protein
MFGLLQLINSPLHPSFPNEAAQWLSVEEASNIPEHFC